jgi:hypothetical protein
MAAASVQTIPSLAGGNVEAAVIAPDRCVLLSVDVRNVERAWAEAARR